MHPVGTWNSSVSAVTIPLSHIILTLTNPCPILKMLSAWLGSDKYQFDSHWFDSTRVLIRVFESQDLLKQVPDAQLIWPSHLVPIRYILFLRTQDKQSYIFVVDYFSSWPNGCPIYKQNSCDQQASDTAAATRYIRPTNWQTHHH